MSFRRITYDLSGIETTGDILKVSAARAPAKPALICAGRATTFAALDKAANRFAHAVNATVGEAGARIAIMCGNAADYVVAHFGAARTRAVLVHMSARYRPAELRHMLKQTRAQLLILDATTIATYEETRGQLERQPVLVGIGGSLAGGSLPDGITSFADFIGGQSETPPDDCPRPDDPFCILATGGTTGKPKGAIASHRARIISTTAAIEDHPLVESDIVAVTTPLGHAAGLFTWFQPAFQVGATSVILSHWDPAAFIAAVEEHAITGAFVVPVQLAMLLDAAEFSPARLNSLRMIACGGAVTPERLIRRFEEALPDTDLILAFGSTETGHTISLHPAERRAKPGILGQTGPRIEMKIFNAAGEQAAPGEIGEIATRGGHLMTGYLDEPEQTADYFRSSDGWGWTGDLGAADEGGSITLHGRSKEMIISGGMNVYPVEIENALLEHPEIVDCAVFGQADEKWGELPAAAVILRLGAALSEQEIIDFSATRIAAYKRVRWVHFTEELPRTAGGKVQRNLLREKFGGEV